jgi:hypothetical protein
MWIIKQIKGGMIIENQMKSNYFTIFNLQLNLIQLSEICRDVGTSSDLIIIR